MNVREMIGEHIIEERKSRCGPLLRGPDEAMERHVQFKKVNNESIQTWGGKPFSR